MKRGERIQPSIPVEHSSADNYATRNPIFKFKKIPKFKLGIPYPAKIIKVKKRKLIFKVFYILRQEDYKYPWYINMHHIKKHSYRTIYLDRSGFDTEIKRTGSLILDSQGRKPEFRRALKKIQAEDENIFVIYDHYPDEIFNKNKFQYKLHFYSLMRIHELSPTFTDKRIKEENIKQKQEKKQKKILKREKDAQDLEDSRIAMRDSDFLIVRLFYRLTMLIAQAIVIVVIGLVLILIFGLIIMD